MKHKKNSSPENEPEYIEELEEEYDEDDEDEEYDEDDEDEEYDEDDEDEEYDEDDEDEDEEYEKPRGLKAFFARIKNSLFEEVEEDEDEDDEEEEDDGDSDEDEEEPGEEEYEEESDEDEEYDEAEDSEPSGESEPEMIVIPEELFRTEEEPLPGDGEIFLDAPEDMPGFREEAVPGYQPPPKKEPPETELPDSETPVIKNDELTAGLEDFFSDEEETGSGEEKPENSEPDTDEQAEDSEPDEEENEEEEEEQNPDGTPKKSILSRIIPVVAVLAVVLGFVYCFQLGLFDEKEAFLMPELVGRNYHELTDEEYTNLDIQVNQSDYSAYDKDVIYAQDIPAGTEIKLGQTVKVDLSLGYQMTVVPDVRNYQFDYAKKLLEQTGFRTQIAYEQSLNGTAQNNVIRTVPGSNEEAAVGSEVTLYVSEGLGAEAAQVQNFTGMLLEDALDLCEMYGLEVETVPAPALQAENVVIAQNIEAGSTVPFHTVITLTYSTGEQPQGTVSYQVNFPAYASGRFILDFIDKDGNVVASSDIIVAGFSAGSVVPIDGFGAQEFTVVLNNCTTNLQAELGKYYFDFTTGTYTMLSEDMQGAFEAVKGIS